MTGKTVFSSLFVCVLLCVNVPAQDYVLGQISMGAPVGALSAGAMAANSRQNSRRLPSDFFSNTTAATDSSSVETQDAENNNASNVIVVCGLAALLMLGCTITGMSVVMRRKKAKRPHALRFAAVTPR